MLSLLLVYPHKGPNSLGYSTFGLKGTLFTVSPCGSTPSLGTLTYGRPWCHGNRCTKSPSEFLREMIGVNPTSTWFLAHAFFCWEQSTTQSLLVQSIAHAGGQCPSPRGCHPWLVPQRSPSEAFLTFCQAGNFWVMESLTGLVDLMALCPLSPPCEVGLLVQGDVMWDPLSGKWL